MPAIQTNHPETDVCRLCGSQSRLVCTQQVLYHYPVGYYQCSTCDLLQTQRPFWLEEAYNSALSALDTGAISRTMLCTELTRALAALLRLGPDDSCIDYGGGHGILTRCMRDHGYDFRWHDKYAHNEFARGFEADPRECHRLLTCFEVWEHLADVGQDLPAFFSPGHHFLLISTYLHHGHRENWWYYSCESGQHVAFFSERTMQHVARQFGYEAIVCQRYTLFYRPRLLSGWRRAGVRLLLHRAKPRRNSRITRMVVALSRPLKSRTWDDHVDLMSKGRPRAAAA